jgi:hypothetical protein
VPNNTAEIKKHVDNSATLVQKMHELTAILMRDLLDNFKTSFGVPLPDAVHCEVRRLNYDMVLATEPLTDQYINSAKQLLNAAFSEDEALVISKALDVVGSLISGIVGSGSVQTGGKANSARIHAKNGKVYVTAIATQTEMCSAKDFLTETNFYVAYYAFAIWQPDLKLLNSITVHEVVSEELDPTLVR